MHIIETEADIAEGIAHLCAGDPVLLMASTVVETVPLRRSEGGFKGLARIVMGQQVSVKAADAIAQRLEARVKPFTAEKVLRLRSVTTSLSRGEMRNKRPTCSVSRASGTFVRCSSQSAWHASCEANSSTLNSIPSERSGPTSLPKS